MNGMHDLGCSKYPDKYAARHEKYSLEVVYCLSQSPCYYFIHEEALTVVQYTHALESISSIQLAFFIYLFLNKACYPSALE